CKLIVPEQKQQILRLWKFRSTPEPTIFGIKTLHQLFECNMCRGVRQAFITFFINGFFQGIRHTFRYLFSLFAHMPFCLFELSEEQYASQIAKSTKSVTEH